MKSTFNIYQTGRSMLMFCCIVSTSVTWGAGPLFVPTLVQPPPPAPSADEGDVKVKPKVEVAPEIKPNNTPSVIPKVTPEVTPIATPGKANLQLISPEEIFTQPVNGNSYFDAMYDVATDWTVSAGPIFLTRDRGDSTVLLRAGTTLASPPLMTARNFDFDYKMGYHVDVTRHFEKFDVQLNHFAVNGWNSSGGSTVAGSFLSPGGLIIPFGGIAQMTYRSNMASVEFNLKPHTNSAVTPFAGFRWVELDERLGQNVNPNLAPAATIDTRNDLYAFQIGTDIMLFNSDIFELTTTGKAAIAGNSARNQITSLPAIAAFTIPQTEIGTTKAAFIYDFAINGTVKVSEHVSISGGYNVIILSEVALAPGQLESNSLANGVFGGQTTPPGSRRLARDDYLLVHGGKIELEITW